MDTRRTDTMDSTETTDKNNYITERLNQNRQMVITILSWYHLIAILTILAAITTFFFPFLAVGQLAVGVLIIVYHLSIQKKLRKKIKEGEQ